VDGHRLCLITGVVTSNTQADGYLLTC